MTNEQQLQILTGKELFQFLRDNKAALKAVKKMATKEADGIPVFSGLAHAGVNKAAGTGGPKGLYGELVINTTNLLDSHKDVHLPGIWNKALKDNDIFMHLQEHKNAFANIIDDNAKGYTKRFTWSELGAPFKGRTEALMFSSFIAEARNK